MRLPVTHYPVGGPNHFYLALYKQWLEKQAKAPTTTRVYYSQVKHFLLFLEYAGFTAMRLDTAAGLNEAIGLYLDFLKRTKRQRLTINANISSLTNFAAFLGLDPPNCKRERCYRRTNAILTHEQQQRFLQVVDRQKSSRDKALALVLFSTGIRIGDCASLNMNHITPGVSSIWLQNGQILPLNERTKHALRQWLEDRKSQARIDPATPLWLTAHGERLSISSISSMIKRIGKLADLGVSVNLLRRTLAANSKTQVGKSAPAMNFFF
jgi:site-specific recombinase XerD